MSATARRPPRTAARHRRGECVVDLPVPVSSHRRSLPDHPSLPHLPLHDITSVPSRSSSRLVSPPRSLSLPGQTPLHRGCAGWASPVEVCVR